MHATAARPARAQPAETLRGTQHLPLRGTQHLRIEQPQHKRHPRHRDQVSQWYQELQSAGADEERWQPLQPKQHHLPEGVAPGSSAGLSTHDIHERQAIRAHKGISGPTLRSECREKIDRRKLRTMDRLNGSQSVASLLGSTEPTGISTRPQTSYLRRSATMGSLRDPQKSQVVVTTMPFYYLNEIRPNATQARFLPRTHHSRTTPHAASSGNFESLERSFVEVPSRNTLELQRGDRMTELLHSALSKTASSFGVRTGTNMCGNLADGMHDNRSQKDGWRAPHRDCHPAIGTMPSAHTTERPVKELYDSLLASNRNVRKPLFNLSTVGLYTGGESAIYDRLTSLMSINKEVKLPGPGNVDPRGPQMRSAEIEDGAGTLISCARYKEINGGPSRMQV